MIATITGHGEKHLVEITIDTDGDRGDATGVVIATDGHLFWQPDLRRWTTAGELTADSLLQTSAGTWTQITALRTWTAPRQVHNLAVNSTHTYYVLAGSTPVLVHNDSPCGASRLPDLNGKSLVEAETRMRTEGFGFVTETSGGYRKYVHADGSQVWIRPSGEVVRLGPKVDPGPNQSNYHPRYGPDGAPTDLHSTGEVIRR